MSQYRLKQYMLQNKTDRVRGKAAAPTRPIDLLGEAKWDARGKDGIATLFLGGEEERMVSLNGAAPWLFLFFSIFPHHQHSLIQCDRATIGNEHQIITDGQFQLSHHTVWYGYLVFLTDGRYLTTLTHQTCNTITCFNTFLNFRQLETF